MSHDLRMLAENTTPRRQSKDKRRADRTPRVATPTQSLVTLRQIEREYGPPYRSSYDLCMSGKLPFVRFVEGGRIWVRRQDFEALIERSLEKQSA
jgi:hypothetical protein